MGQKVNPIGFRLGIYKSWPSRWFARGNAYGDLVIEDMRIRQFIDERLERGEISCVEIEKAGDLVRIIVHSGRPGGIIGKRGQGADALKTQLSKLLGKNVDISVQEIKKPEMDALLVAKNIAEQLEKRGSFKRAMKRAAQSAKRSGALGIKICCGGRLGGAEIARKEWLRVGSVPLHTLRKDIDYGFAEALTTYGVTGVKVWIYKGDYQRVREHLRS
jgi:small subunit ribosomal protein S3